MEIQKIKIGDLVPAEYNPRLISNKEQEKLKNSIKTFGLVDPIIVNLKNMRIIGGHQRYDVLVNKSMIDNEFLQELNMIRLGDIGWVFTDTELSITDEDHEKALNLALNKISGEWDSGKLTEVLNDLSSSEFDFELSGFTDLELYELNTLNEVEFYDESDDIEEAYDKITKEKSNKEDEGEMEKIMVICPECNHEFELGE